MTETQELLSDYARTGSEEAFRELVLRYFDLVYSTAVRLVNGDTHLAEDVAQMVFSDLAQSASKLSEGTMLGGWLHRHTIFVCRTVMRGQRRRLFREKQAAEMRTLNDQGLNVAAELAPILDEAINELGVDDRAAILLRFFERHSLRSVGEALGMSENAAQKRVARAISELGLILQKRGVMVSLAALGSALATTAVQAAPVGLALTISGVALVNVGTSTSTGLAAAKVAVVSKLKAGIAAAVLVTALLSLVYFSKQNTNNAPAGNRVAGRQSLEPQENLITRESALDSAATLASDSQALKPAPQTGDKPEFSDEQTAQDTGSSLLQAPLLPGGFPGKMRYTAKPGAIRLRITGSSNIHDWQVETSLIGGYMEFGAAAPTPASVGTSSNSVWAKAEVFVPVKSLASVKEDGSPYSTSMDALVYQSLKANRHPRIVYSLLNLSFKGSTNYQGATWFEYSSRGKLAIAGVTNDISMPVFIFPKDGGGALNICGATTLKMTSFHIEPPAQKILSQTIQAADVVAISFSWNVAPRP